MVLEAAPLTTETRRRTGGGGHLVNPFGFSLQPSSPQTRHDEPLTDFPLIANVIPGGSAFQSVYFFIIFTLIRFVTILLSVLLPDLFHGITSNFKVNFFSKKYWFFRLILLLFTAVDLV